jgi:hypothetical protein
VLALNVRRLSRDWEAVDGLEQAKLGIEKPKMLLENDSGPVLCDVIRRSISLKMGSSCTSPNDSLHLPVTRGGSPVRCEALFAIL